MWNKLFIWVSMYLARKYLLRRLSLDPIDRSPFGHLMKFTQRSFPLTTVRKPATLPSGLNRRYSRPQSPSFLLVTWLINTSGSGGENECRWIRSLHIAYNAPYVLAPAPKFCITFGFHFFLLTLAAGDLGKDKSFTSSNLILVPRARRFLVEPYRTVSRQSGRPRWFGKNSSPTTKYLLSSRWLPVDSFSTWPL